MTAPPPTPADVARLVRAARGMFSSGLLARITPNRNVECNACGAWSAYGLKGAPHSSGCPVGALLGALAPWADAREEDRDG